MIRVTDLMTRDYEHGGPAGLLGRGLDRADFVQVWRVVHHASQALAELGKSWGQTAPDESHSTLDWEGSRVTARAGHASATLDLYTDEENDHHPDIVMAIDQPAENLTIEKGPIRLEGHTVAELTNELRGFATEYLGPERQPARPAPDLPAHPLAEGATFGKYDAGTMAALEDHYTVARGLLDRLVATLDPTDEDDGHDLEPRLWPHHFDLASLKVVRRDAEGSMLRTIGVGLTPPDSVAEFGYFYVSPWSSTPLDWESISLPFGFWLDRGDESPPMAVLPLEAVWAIVDECEEEDSFESIHLPKVAVAEFVAAAFNNCMENLTRS